MKKFILRFLSIIILLAIGYLIGSEFKGFNHQISRKDAAQASELFGIDFTKKELDMTLENLNGFTESYEKIRAMGIPNGVMPSLLFNPIPNGFKFNTVQEPIKWSNLGEVNLPDNLNDLAFYTVGELSVLIKSKRITSVELTKFFIERMKKYQPKLQQLITLTEELAMEQATRADKEIAEGKYRGPLHGIPYGAKDLLNTKKYKTTYGATPYKDQIIDMDATVIKKLEEAGAVLIAKLTLGALANGDVWFDGITKNPWDTTAGSSGSSAGPASAVSGGLVPFAIGSETWGSIVSPSTRCGATGLRPTYGRVSRYGAMALSWSMDKLGPIARSVEDCAMVFNAIYGLDEMDPTLYDAAFNYKTDIDLATLKIGYLKSDFDQDTANSELNDMILKTMTDLGVKLIPIELPDFPVYDISFILDIEAAAAFEELTLTNRDDLLVRQDQYAWPNVFRTARFVPAVEYIQASRARTLLINQMDKAIKDIDVYIAPSFSSNLLLTNLTGHPCVVLPTGFENPARPNSITFMGHLFDEATVLGVAKAFQDATDFHKQHPKMD